MTTLTMCQACGRHRATGIWAVTMRLHPDKTRLRIMCACCGLDSYPSRHGVLRISLIHCLGELSHLEGPECTSTLVPQADAVTINGHFFITCKCMKCSWATQYELTEVRERCAHNTHINLHHPDNAHRIKVTEAVESPSTVPEVQAPCEVQSTGTASGVALQLWACRPWAELSASSCQA